MTDALRQYVQAGPSSDRGALDIVPIRETETHATFSIELYKWPFQKKSEETHMEVEFAKLTETNWEEWSVNFEAVAMLMGSWETIDKQWLKRREGDMEVDLIRDPWARHRVRLMWALVYLRCSPEVQKNIRHVRDGRTAMKILENLYAPRDAEGNVLAKGEQEEDQLKQLANGSGASAGVVASSAGEALASLSDNKQQQSEHTRQSIKTRGTRRVFRRGKR